MHGVLAASSSFGLARAESAEDARLVRNWDEYQVVCPLGRGAFAEVLRVRRRTHTYAVKRPFQASSVQNVTATRAEFNKLLALYVAWRPWNTWDNNLFKPFVEVRLESGAGRPRPRTTLVQQGAVARRARAAACFCREAGQSLRTLHGRMSTSAVLVTSFDLQLAERQPACLSHAGWRPVPGAAAGDPDGGLGHRPPQGAAGL
jgi:hypothetical protein